MNGNTLGRIAVFLGVLLATGGGWWLSKQRVAGLEAENARLLKLVNEGRMIGSTRTRTLRDEIFDVRISAETMAAPIIPPVEIVPGDGDVLVSSEELDALEGKLAEVLLPLEEENIASSMVNAAVRDGETLVTGGYRDGNGNFVFTLATPKAADLGNGEEGVEFSLREVIVPAGRVAELGLDSIASGARNTLQHGETWTSQEADSVIEKILADPGSVTMTAPSITARPGQQASVQMGEADRSRTISINAEALPDASGYALRLRVEHRGIDGAVTE